MKAAFEWIFMYGDGPLHDIVIGVFGGCCIFGACLIAMGLWAAFFGLLDWLGL